MTATDILAKQKLELVEVLRNGPRFFVARVGFHNQQYIFKFLLDGESSENYTKYWAHNLKREILFQVWYRSYSRFRIPRVIDYSLEPELWYLREEASGKLLAQKGSNFLFKSHFFTKRTIEFADFIYELQEATLALPKNLRPLTATQFDGYKDDVFYNQLALLSNKECDFIGRDVLENVKIFYAQNKTFFLENHEVLAHRELYATNILVDRGKIFTIIDWENIENRDYAHDISILWVRAFAFPNWQKNFLLKFLTKISDQDKFWQLFYFNIITQQIGNIAHFMAFPNRYEKRNAAIFLPFARQSIVMALENKVYI